MSWCWLIKVHRTYLLHMSNIYKNTILDKVLTWRKDMEKVSIILETLFWENFIEQQFCMQCSSILASNFSKTYKGQKKPFQYWLSNPPSKWSTNHLSLDLSLALFSHSLFIPYIDLISSSLTEHGSNQPQFVYNYSFGIFCSHRALHTSAQPCLVLSSQQKTLKITETKVYHLDFWHYLY